MKRSTTQIWPTAVMLASVVLTCIATPATAQDASIIRATRVDGAVTRNAQPLKEGEVVGRDDRIETAANAAAVLTWSNGSIVEIYPETRLVIRGVVFEGERKLERTLLTLERGRLFVKAQVPEHLFNHLDLRLGDASLMSQGAELAIRYEEGEKRATVWSLIGVTIVEVGGQKIRIDEGQQAAVKPGAPPGPAGVMPEKTREALTKTSTRLGGSLLVEEAPSTGGPLHVKIGGVKNRRGNAPYAVTLKALVGGGSGRIKSISWSLGDGKSATGKDVQHTFTQGVYVVVVRVEDENGQKASAQLNISVEEQCGC
ncbi:MAG TPA: PKD domain-containing protein [Methylomirabilota bacterium]|nr:PKD domain-containing protein [Methylomirabilota bacterium]